MSTLSRCLYSAMWSFRLLNYSITRPWSFLMFYLFYSLSYYSIVETYCSISLDFWLILIDLLMSKTPRSGIYLKDGSTIRLFNYLFCSIWYSSSDSITLKIGSLRIIVIASVILNSSFDKMSPCWTSLRL